MENNNDSVSQNVVTPVETQNNQTQTTKRVFAKYNKRPRPTSDVSNGEQSTKVHTNKRTNLQVMFFGGVGLL